MRPSRLRFHSYTAALVLLAGSGINQDAAAYSISENQLNQQLTTELATRQLDRHVFHLSHQQQQLTLNITLSGLKLQLLAQRGGIARVALNTTLRGTAQIFGQPLQIRTQLTPTLESGLHYHNGGLYLVNPTLTKLEITDTPSNRALLQPLLISFRPVLEQSLRQWFSHNPVYQLGNNVHERFARQYLESVTIGQGHLQLNFDQGSEDELY